MSILDAVQGILQKSPVLVPFLLSLVHAPLLTSLYVPKQPMQIHTQGSFHKDSTHSSTLTAAPKELPQPASEVQI